MVRFGIYFESVASRVSNSLHRINKKKRPEDSGKVPRVLSWETGELIVVFNGLGINQKEEVWEQNSYVKFEMPM